MLTRANLCSVVFKLSYKDEKQVIDVNVKTRYYKALYQLPNLKAKILDRNELPFKGVAFFHANIIFEEKKAMH